MALLKHEFIRFSNGNTNRIEDYLNDADREPTKEEYKHGVSMRAIERRREETELKNLKVSNYD